MDLCTVLSSGPGPRGRFAHARVLVPLALHHCWCGRIPRAATGGWYTTVGARLAAGDGGGGRSAQAGLWSRSKHRPVRVAVVLSFQ